MASAPIFSPARVGRTNRSICASAPAATMCGTAILQVNRMRKRLPDSPIRATPRRSPPRRRRRRRYRPRSGRLRRAGRRRPPRGAGRGELVAFPVVDVGRDFAFGGARTVFAGRHARVWSRCSLARLLLIPRYRQQCLQDVAGMSMYGFAAICRGPSPADQNRGRGDALEDILDDEVHRPQVGQQMPGDRQPGGFGQQLPEVSRR